MKGPRVAKDIDRDGDELRLLGFEISSEVAYSLPMNKGERTLVTISAVKALE
jgi:hypothetical protein